MPGAVDAGGTGLRARLGNAAAPPMGDSRSALLFLRDVDRLAGLFVRAEPQRFIFGPKERAPSRICVWVAWPRRGVGNSFSLRYSARESRGVARFVDRAHDAAGQRRCSRFVSRRSSLRAPFHFCRMVAPDISRARSGLPRPGVAPRSRRRDLSRAQSAIARIPLAGLGRVANDRSRNPLHAVTAQLVVHSRFRQFFHDWIDRNFRWPRDRGRGPMDSKPTADEDPANGERNYCPGITRLAGRRWIFARAEPAFAVSHARWNNRRTEEPHSRSRPVSRENFSAGHNDSLQLRSVLQPGFVLRPENDRPKSFLGRRMENGCG